MSERTLRGVRVANLVFAVLFAVSALIQLNDPDPVGWVAIYGAAAVCCLIGWFAPAAWLPAALVGAAALVWAATFARHVPELAFGDLFGKMKAERPAIELAREMLGLLIVAGWMAAIVVRRGELPEVLEPHPPGHPSAPTLDGDSRLAQRLLLGLALAAITILAYASVYDAGFIWDDDVYVEDNRTLRSADGLRRIWFQLGATPQYYPLVHTTYWIEYRLWGLAPRGFHAVNVLLHAAGAILLWRILARLGFGAGAWLAAALFALHPVHVESVAWITERKNVLSGALYLGSARVMLPMLVRAPDGDRPAFRVGRYALGLSLFVAALLSKTVVASLPAALLLVVWWRDGRIGRRQIAMLVPFFVSGISLGLLTVRMETETVGASGVEWHLSWIERFVVAGRAVGFYLAKLVWPVGLAFNYPLWSIDATELANLSYPITAAAATLVLWARRARWGRGPVTAALFFGGTLVPAALGFFDVYPMRYSFVADHFQYLASLGPIVGVAWVAGRAATRLGRAGRRATWVGVAVVLAVLGVLTWRQASVYEDRTALWTHTLEVNPSSWLAHSNLGEVLLAQGRGEQALVHFEKALRIQGGQPKRPDLAQAHNNVGIALVACDRPEEALASFHRSLAIRPGYPKAHHNIGVVLRKQGRLAEARSHFEAALAGWPDYANAHFNLANTLVLEGRIGEAIPHFERALQLAPDREDVRENLRTARELLQRGSPRPGSR